MIFRRRPRVTEVVSASSENGNTHLSLAFLRTALNALPMGVIVVDDNGKEWWRNRAAHNQADAQTDGESIEKVLQQMSQSALRGRSDVQQVTVDGAPPRTLEVKSLPMINGGAIIVMEDITEQFLTDKVRTDFVANISHELKTPVGALSVLAETIAAESEEEGGNPDLVPLARRMVLESHRVSHIIDDLLELASIEFRGSERYVVMGIVSLVNEAVARAQPRADRNGVSIKTEFIDSDISLRGDDRQLVSAISNLVENAVKYSEHGDTVTVRVNSDSENATIEVIDEGIGISAEHLDRVFERFYRVDQARSRDTGGTGLGLAIVRHVLNNHGGEVNVRSTEGEGSTFTLTIPRFLG